MSAESGSPDIPCHMMFTTTHHTSPYFCFYFFNCFFMYSFIFFYLILEVTGYPRFLVKIYSFSWALITRSVLLLDVACKEFWKCSIDVHLRKLRTRLSANSFCGFAGTSLRSRIAFVDCICPGIGLGCLVIVYVIISFDTNNQICNMFLI